MNRLQFLRLAAVATLGLMTSPFAAHAEDYPNRPIRIIAPYPPGGTTDIVARYVANGLSKSLGWTVIVENRTGAGGIVGHEAAAKATPDGYTLVLGNSAMLAVSVSLFPKLPYNPTKDFAPITEAAAGALVLVVKPALPVHSLQELLALAKKEPGKLNAGLSALGSMHHMTTEIIEKRAGVKWTNVPYKGSAPMLMDLLSGQIDFAFDNIPSSLPYIKSGKLRAIAVSGSTRTDLLPDVPTLAESGMKGVEALAWHGVLAPANTPAPIVARLHDEIVKILKTAEMKKRLNDLGLDPIGSSPEAFATFIREENVRWAQIAHEADIKLDQ
jgi:tripartite-type tricarboxylate transporter receptor subunit TctC